MQTPELLLDGLINQLLRLRGATAMLNHEELNNGLSTLTQRLLYAQALADNWIIAVGGSQGAGKTTLMERLCGLDSAAKRWLVPNEGRGERVPVLIVEDSAVQVPQGEVRELAPKTSKVGDILWSVQTRVLTDVNEFQQIVTGRAPQSAGGLTATPLLPVLRVPRRIFPCDGQAFLLLPGYEKVSEGNRGWQALTRQCLVGAAGCLIVTDQTRLAGSQDAQILQDMLSNELRATDPIIVVSKTEDAPPAALESLRTTAAEAFKIDASMVPSRVHCTGTGNTETWLPALQGALQDVAIGGVGRRVLQLKQLMEIMDKDLGSLIRLAHTQATLFFHAQKTDVSGDEETLANILEIYDDECNRVKKQFSQAIEKALRSRANRAFENLEPVLADKHEGALNKVKNIFMPTSRKEATLRADLLDSWRDGGNLLQEFNAAAAAVTQKRLQGTVPVQTNANLGTRLQALGYAGGDSSVVEWKRPGDGDARNYRALLVPVSNEQDHIITTKQLEASIALLPTLVLEYARACSSVPELAGRKADAIDKALPQADLNAALANVEQQFSEAKGLSLNLLRGLAAMLAIDVGVDGQLDSIPALLSALTSHLAPSAAAAGGGASAVGAAGAAAGVATAVVGVLAVVYLVHAANKEVRSFDQQVRDHAHKTLLLYAEHTAVDFQDRLQDLFDVLRERLSDRVQQRYHLDQTLGRKDRVFRTLAALASKQEDFLAHIRGSGQDLGLSSGAMV